MKKLRKDSTCSTLAVKCYDEQLSAGERGLIEAIKAVSADEIQILAIHHNRSISKAHWHVIMKTSRREKKMRVVSTLKKLSIVFRDGIDDELWNNRGVETVGNFSNYATYLLHETEAAKKDGKESYDKKEYITNLMPDEVGKILAGYTVRSKSKVSSNDYYDMAREAGYNLEDVNAFISGLGAINMKPTAEASIRKAYDYGVKSRMQKHERLHRLLISIVKPKTLDDKRLRYSIEKALDDKRLFVHRSGEPLFVEASTEVLVTDDRYLRHCTSNDYIVEIKDDIAGKVIWAGNIVIYIDSIAIKDGNCFVCRIENDKLICDIVPKFDAPNSEQERIKSEYLKFRDGFNAAYAEYAQVTITEKVDFSDINNYN